MAVEFKTYKVSIGFAGFIGVENEYEVDATSEDEAREEALQMAYDDLSIENVTCYDDDDEDE